MRSPGRTAVESSTGHVLLVQNGGQDVLEMRKINRLCEVCGKARFAAFLDVIFHPKTAHCDCLHGAELSESAQGIPSGTVGQTEIADDEIRPRMFVLLARRFDSFRHSDSEATTTQSP